MGSIDRHIVLTRYGGHKHAILSDLHVYGDGRRLFDCKALELPYRDNQRYISAIPIGTYPLQLEYSPRFNMELWELYGVPRRSEIKIHVANYARQLNGCIAVGNGRRDIDGDGKIDLVHSRNALHQLHQAMMPATRAYITITDIINHY